MPLLQKKYFNIVSCSLFSLPLNLGLKIAYDTVIKAFFLLFRNLKLDQGFSNDVYVSRKTGATTLT